MATALRNIQFSKPMLVGEANSDGGTTYALGSYDVLGPIAQGEFFPAGAGCGQVMWGFDGFARYAEEANSADSARVASSVSLGSSGEYSLSYASIGALPDPTIFGSPEGSWATLRDYLEALGEALHDIADRSVVVLGS